MDASEYLPLRMINQIRFCERRFWYMYVQGEMTENAPILEGLAQHERVHKGGESHRGAKRIFRRTWLWSDRLRIAGMGDVIEECEGLYRPVEYKRGRQGKWDNDAAQLCAQAMCIEERTGTSVPTGSIFYNASRHRVEVVFDATLRVLTETLITRAYALLDQGRVPPPIPPEQRARCRDCSLLFNCMPDEVLQLTYP